MAIRQSVLALYGAISDGLTSLNEGTSVPTEDAQDLRILGAEIAGLTGSAGERGWYGELLRYLDDNRSGEDRVTSPDWDDIIEDLTSEEDNQRLQPTWASRAIAAAYVLDRLALAEVGPRREADLLALTIAAAPSEGPGWNETGRVGPDHAAELANALLGTRVNSRDGFWRNMRQMSGQLATSVASMQTTAGLRKVKREYCSVVTTTAEWPDITYDKLKSVIEPVNWSSFFPQFFCKMQLQGADAHGWSRIRESVSGDCDRYTLDTGLKFWKQERPGGLFLNYDMDADRTHTDKLVLVDNGYIWITPKVARQPHTGVRVRTSKQLLISGMSATAMTKLAEFLGWATNSTDMFYYAAKYQGPAAAFSTSQPGTPPQQDTSTTWPVMVPHIPADLRDEYCADTTELIKKRLQFANTFAHEFADRWKDGLDLAEFDELNDMMTAEAKTAAKEAFDAATENFRPKAPTP